jgi:hypothetical protein
MERVSAAAAVPSLNQTQSLSLVLDDRKGNQGAYERQAKRNQQVWDYFRSWFR